MLLVKGGFGLEGDGAFEFSEPGKGILGPEDVELDAGEGFFGPDDVGFELSGAGAELFGPDAGDRFWLPDPVEFEGFDAEFGHTL